MGWLPAGLLFVVGLGVLVWMALGAMGRLVRGRAAAAALRVTLTDGFARLRAGRDRVRDWRRSRGGSNSGGPESA